MSIIEQVLDENFAELKDVIEDKIVGKIKSAIDAKKKLVIKQINEGKYSD